MASVLVVSDTHLSPRTPEADANWRAVVDHAGRRRFDLVLHLGDVSLDGAAGPIDLEHARRRLDELPVPWRAVPGNHDVGDNPTPDGVHGHLLDQGSRRRWLDVMGPDRWALGLDDWLVVGLDAQLFGSGLEAEDEQWAWLDGVVGGVAADRPLALVLHKPIWASADELATSPSYRYVTAACRDRLDRSLGARPVPLVLSGHVHQRRTLIHGARRHEWAPTTWALVPDDVQPWLGDKRCGVLEVDLAGPTADVRMTTPPGLAQHTIGVTIANPYGASH